MAIAQLQDAINEGPLQADHRAILTEALRHFIDSLWWLTVSGGRQRDPAKGFEKLRQAGVALAPLDYGDAPVSEMVYTAIQAALDVARLAR